MGKDTATLTGTGDNRNVTQQAEDLRAEEGAIPNVEEFVEKNLWTGKALLMKKYHNSSCSLSPCLTSPL